MFKSNIKKKNEIKSLKKKKRFKVLRLDQNSIVIIFLFINIK